MIRVSSFGKLKHLERDRYIQRVQKMLPFQWTEIPIKRSTDFRDQKLMPEEKKFLESNTTFCLIDVRGKKMNSDEFYRLLFQASERHLVVGPAVGFHEDFFSKARESISLSPLTLTHGTAQLVLAEALYRAACQLKNHPFVK